MLKKHCMVRYLRSGVLVPVVIHVTLHGHWDNFLCFDFDGSGMWGPPSWEWHRIVASESWVLPAQNDPTCNAGWWFGTGFIFPYIGNNHPNWRTHIFQRGGSTTNQVYNVIPTEMEVCERHPPWGVHQEDQEAQEVLHWDGSHIPDGRGEGRPANNPTTPSVKDICWFTSRWNGCKWLVNIWISAQRVRSVRSGTHQFHTGDWPGLPCWVLWSREISSLWPYEPLDSLDVCRTSRVMNS